MMDKFYFWCVLLLLASIFYMYARNKMKTREKDERISKLERQLNEIKTRHMTAKGGLGRDDKLKLLDLIAKADLIEDDSQLVQLRVADLKRSMIEFLNKEKRRV